MDLDAYTRNMTDAINTVGQTQTRYTAAAIITILLTSTACACFILWFMKRLFGTHRRPIEPILPTPGQAARPIRPILTQADLNRIDALRYGPK